MHDLNYGATRHVSCDRACTWIGVTQPDAVCGREEVTLWRHTANQEEDAMVICHNMWQRTIFLFILPFIYHVYFYSWSCDWWPSFSHMTQQESSFTFSCDSSFHDSCQLTLTYSDSLVFHPLIVSLLCFTFVSFLFHDSHENIHRSHYLLF